jgi:hypothetical protein
LLLGPGWRAPAPRGRPRGEETERPRKVEERDGGGGLGEGAGVDESVPWWRLWGGRYAIANAAAANCHPTPARMVWSGPRRWWGGNGKVAECEAMMAVRGRFIYRVHRFKKSVEFADFFKNFVDSAVADFLKISIVYVKFGTIKKIVLFI